jgi:hypothetical protein
LGGYLVVAHQTAGSAELVNRLLHIVLEDGAATFTLLIPATEPGHLLIWEAGSPTEIAGRKAEQAQALLQSRGIEVARTIVGHASPLQAIEDEVVANPGEHSTVILCTLPPGISNWLGLDVPDEAGRSFGIPVEYVTAGSAYR